MSRMLIYILYPPLLRALVLLVFCCAITALAAGLYVGATSEHDRYLREISASEHELKELNSNIASVSLWHKYKRALDYIDKKLNQNTSQAVLIKSLSKIVSETKVVANDQTFQETHELNGARIFKQALVIEGDYKSVRHFLSKLSDSMPGINVINRMSISKGSGNIIAVNITLDTYAVNAQ